MCIRCKLHYVNWPVVKDCKKFTYYFCSNWMMIAYSLKQNMIVVKVLCSCCQLRCVDKRTFGLFMESNQQCQNTEEKALIPAMKSNELSLFFAIHHWTPWRTRQMAGINAGTCIGVSVLTCVAAWGTCCDRSSQTCAPHTVRRHINIVIFIVWSCTTSGCSCSCCSPDPGGGTGGTHGGAAGPPRRTPSSQSVHTARVYGAFDVFYVNPWLCLLFSHDHLFAYVRTLHRRKALCVSTSRR